MSRISRRDVLLLTAQPATAGIDNRASVRIGEIGRGMTPQYQVPEAALRQALVKVKL